MVAKSAYTANRANPENRENRENLANPANPANPENPGNLDSCDVFHLDPAKVAGLKTTLLGARAVIALAETFKVLGDMTRVRILDALSRSELCVCDIARLLGLSESAVSHQL